MKSQLARFNTYLALAGLLLVLGCKSAEERERSKAFATFRIHLEYPNGPTNRVSQVQVFGVPLTIQKDPFLNEYDLTGATLVDTPDGLFAIAVQFDRHGTLMIDSVSTQFRGRRLVFFSQYGLKEDVKTAWLAAPIMVRPISDGRLQFTPALPREEAEKIVLGLSNRIRKNKKDNTTW